MTISQIDRAARITLHLRISTYRHVLGMTAPQWSQIETADMRLLELEAANLKGAAEIAIEAERQRPWLQEPNWDE